MTLQELRYLVALADHRHFGRAAEACHVTQPTLSAQLRKLESYLGQTLIDRAGRLPVLTPVGEQIVQRARRLLAEADDILKLTRSRNGVLEGALTIGMIPTLAPYYLPTMLKVLQQDYPKLQLIVQEELTATLREKLDEQMLDVAVLALPSGLDADRYAELPLFDEPFWVASPPGHALAAATSVSSEQLASLKLLLLTDGHCLRGQALSVCHYAEPPDDDSADYRATSLETLRQLVAAGLGSTLLPALAIRPADRGELVIRPLAGQESRRIALIWREGHSRSAEIKALGESLLAALPEGTLPIAD